LLFWTRLAGETVAKHVVIVATIARLFAYKISIGQGARARGYRDTALTPVRDDEDVELDLLTKTAGARASVEHARKVAELTAGGQSIGR
jgi:hypothetical protein